MTISICSQPKKETSHSLVAVYQWRVFKKKKSPIKQNGNMSIHLNKYTYAKKMPIQMHVRITDQPTNLLNIFIRKLKEEKKNNNSSSNIFSRSRTFQVLHSSFIFLCCFFFSSSKLHEYIQKTGWFMNLFSSVVLDACKNDCLASKMKLTRHTLTRAFVCLYLFALCIWWLNKQKINTIFSTMALNYLNSILL